MNWPNFFTLLRIFFVPLLVAALVQDGFWLSRPWVVGKEFIAVSIFLAAAATASSTDIWRGAGSR